MYPVIVSFYTPDWEYPAHADRLRSECDALGLEHRIEQRQSVGNYLGNTCLKPQYIRDCLTMGRPILWVDVDGSIYRRPDFFVGLDADFAARRMGPHRKRTWHVGTMYFAPAPEVIEFVDEWIRITGECSDESALEQTIRSREWGFRCSDIPPEYFEIQTARHRLTDKTVIMHRISSGKSKRDQSAFFNRYEQEVI